jgi:hypothetical protein
MAKTISIGTFLLTAEFDISLTQRREIFEQPQARGGERTLSVKIVGNGVANECFKFYFDANATGFDPRKRVNAIIYDDGLPYFEGVAKLVEVTTLRDKVVYSLVIFGKIIDLFSDIGDKNIRDLDMSEYNHTYDKIEVSESIGNVNQVNNVTTPGMPDGKGYRYVNANYGEYMPEHVRYLRPAYYVKEVFERIIEEAGYELQSDFISGDTSFAKVGLLNGGDWEKTAEEVEDDSVEAVSEGLQVNPFSLITFTDVVSDPNSNFASSIYTVPTSGKYTIEGIIEYYLVWTDASLSIAVLNDIRYFHTSLSLRRNGQSYSVVPLYPVSYPPNSAITLNDPSSEVISPYIFEDIELEAGDQIQLSFFRGVTIANIDLTYLRPQGQPRRGAMSFNVKAGSVLKIRPSSEISIGSLVTNANALPDVKQKDFIKWVMNMFNMILDYDKLTPNKVIIEPYDDYLSSELIELPLDLSKDIVTSPIPDDLSGNWRFTYKEGEDIISDRYQSRFGEVFGTKEQLSENEFIITPKVVEVGFNIAPFFRINKDDKFITSIANTDGKPSKGAYVGFIKNDITCNEYILFFASSGTGIVQVTTTDNKYSYFGNYDDPINPTKDLSFAPPKAVYHIVGGNAYEATNATLFNEYWRKRVLRYQNPNTKVLKCYVHINQILINDMTFDKLYFLNNNYYRLIAINNYKGIEMTTQCIFVSELFIPDFVSETKNIGGGGDQFGNGDTAPDTFPVGDRFRGTIGFNDAGTIARGMTIGSPSFGAGVSINSYDTPVPLGAMAINTSEVDDIQPGDLYINGYMVPLSVKMEITDVDVGSVVAFPVNRFTGYKIEIVEILIASSGTPYGSGTMEMKYVGGSVIRAFPAALLTTTDKLYRFKPTLEEVEAANIEFDFPTVPPSSEPSFKLELEIKYIIHNDN